MNRTGTNEATTRHNLLAQRFTAVGALIASGAPWRALGISAAENENNAQATRAESARAVLVKAHRATPETAREPAFGERWGVTFPQLRNSASE